MDDFLFGLGLFGIPLGFVFLAYLFHKYELRRRGLTECVFCGKAVKKPCASRCKMMLCGI